MRGLLQGDYELREATLLDATIIRVEPVEAKLFNLYLAALKDCILQKFVHVRCDRLVSLNFRDVRVFGSDDF